MKNKTKHYKVSASEWLFAVLKYIFLILWAMTTFVPLLWVLINAFKSSGRDPAQQSGFAHVPGF